MGALTLKSFPFELRGWDIEKFESIDPTDGFGISTRVYISKQQIIQIEPDHAEATSNPWLSDKGRQFFDSIFGAWSKQSSQDKNLILKKDSWQQDIKTLLKTLYLFEHCNTKTKRNHFFTIVFENLGIETLSLLKVIEQSYSFIKLRRAESSVNPNDLESNFQLNAVINANKLKSSTLCLLIANNPRYEGYPLNLSLRQRYLKGNFNCLVLGSLTDLTFPTRTIGTNLKVLKAIAEGNNFVCQDFKTAKNPLLVANSEFFSRNDGKNMAEMLTNFQKSNLLDKAWNGMNVLSSTLHLVGTQSIANFLPLKKIDFTESSSFYFLNVSTHTVPNLKKVAESKLLNYTNAPLKKQPDIKKLILDQNSLANNNEHFSKRNLAKQNYKFVPSKMFYENEETFINTEGLIKRTTKLITKRKTREGWKLLRNLLKQLKSQHISMNNKDNNILSFDAVKQHSFSNFINFHYCATEKLDSHAPSLGTQNQPFFIHKQDMSFKQKPLKIINSKAKYWLDDFFTGGKDEYSKTSLVLSNCSKIQRTQFTNFF